MPRLNLEIFDEFISGTATTWYTPASFNEVLGREDLLLVMALATNVSGTSASASIYVDGSNDNQNWVLDTAPTFSVSPLVEGAMSQATLAELTAFIRMRVVLVGTNPACRLKLNMTARS